VREDDVRIALHGFEIAPLEHGAGFGGRDECPGARDEAAGIGGGGRILAFQRFVDHNDEFGELAQPGEGGIVQDELE